MAAAAALGISCSAFAQVGWDGGGSNQLWTTANNWSPNGVPTSSTRVRLAGDPEEIFEIDLGGQNRTVRSLTVDGGGAANEYGWFLDNGRVTATEFLRVENDGYLSWLDGLAITTPVVDLRSFGVLDLDGTASNSIGSILLNDGTLGLYEFADFSTPINLTGGISSIYAQGVGGINLVSPLSGAGRIVLDASGLGDFDYLPMRLSGSSAGMAGPINVSGGVVRVTRPDALGQGGFNAQTMTIVEEFGRLELEGNWASDEHIEIGGFGPESFKDPEPKVVRMGESADLGALASKSGAQLLTNLISVRSDSQIRVDAGAVIEHASALYTGSGNPNTTVYKNGDGVYRFVNSGSTSLPIVVERGTLALRSFSNQNLMSGTITVAPGALLNLESSYQFNRSTANLVVNGIFNNNGHFDDINGLSGSGTVNLSGAFGVGWGGSDTTFAGTLTGAVSFYKHGTGTLVLGGSTANSSTGVTVVTGGALVLSKPIGVNAIGGDLAVEPNSTVRLANYSQILDGATVALNNGVLNLALFNDTIGRLELKGGRVALGDADGLGLSGTSPIVVTPANPAVPDSSSIESNLSLTSAHEISVAGNSRLVISGGIKTRPVPGLIGSIVKTNAGTLELSGGASHTYTGSTTVTGGTLLVTGTGRLANTSELTVAAGATFDAQRGNVMSPLILAPWDISGTFHSGNGFAQTLPTTTTLRGGRLTGTGAGLPPSSPGLTGYGHFAANSGRQLQHRGNLPSTIDAPGGIGLQPTGADTSPFIIDVEDGTAAADLTITSNIFPAESDPVGVVGITKIGAGTLVLAGANAYGGTTSILAGLIAINGDNGLGRSTAPLNFDGGGLQFNNSFNLSPTRPISLSAGGGSINLPGTTTAISQPLSGLGGLTKTGSGTLVLGGTADNTYTGTTTVEAGTLALAKSQNISAVAGGAGLVVNAGATLLSQQTSVISDEVPITINGGLWHIGSFAELQSSTMTVSNGGRIIGSGRVLLRGASQLVSENGGTIESQFRVLEDNYPINVLSGTLTITGEVQGSDANRGISKIGAGTLVLGGTTANTYTGTTTVAAGTLVLAKPAETSAIRGPLVVNAGAVLQSNSSANIANSALVRINGGAWNLGGSYETQQNLVVENNGIVSGPGSLVLFAGSLTSSGGGTISAGVSLTGAFPTYTVDVTSGTLLLTGGIGLEGTLPAGFTKSGTGTLILGGAAANTYTGRTTVSAGTLRVNNTADDVIFTAGGADVRSGAALIFDYAGGTNPDSSVRSALQSGYAGNWLTGQIISTTAAGNVGLGYVNDGALSQIVIKPSLYGDADVDGTVAFNDLLALAQNYNVTGVGVWSTGDFNYDNDVNFSDLLVLAQNYESALVGSGTGITASHQESMFAHDWAMAQSLIPEPGIAMTSLAAGVLLVGRRRRVR